MERILKALSEWLVQQNAIESDDRELYEYAMYSFLISYTPLAIFLVAGGFMGMLPEGLLIVVPFMVIRKFSGGYHAKHAYTCTMMSTGLLIGSCYLVVHAKCFLAFYVLAGISGLSVILNSPLDSENKKLEDDERAHYRRATCFLVMITMVLYSALFALNQSRYAVCVAVSLILAAALQLPCIVKKGKGNGVFAQN